MPLYDPRRPDWWTPTYSTSRGTLFTVSEVRSNECPVSCITKKSNELVQIFHRSRVLQDSGVASFKASDMPIPLADAFVVISGEQARYENAVRDYDEFDQKHANDQANRGKE